MHNAAAVMAQRHSLPRPHPPMAAFFVSNRGNFKPPGWRGTARRGCDTKRAWAPSTFTISAVGPWRAPSRVRSCAIQAPAWGLIVLDTLFRRANIADVMTTSDLTSAPVEPGRERPLIGLVLGSGAARGFAHIGVLQVLLEHDIVPDIVIGTSMGALVGGSYACNQLETLETWARSLTMRRIIGYMDVRLGGSGLISGGRLANRLHDSIGAILIEDLPMRFAAITTEIGTGHEVWLTRGSLSLALRASYALPGVFPPVHVGQRWLVDGALVNPVPVSAARAFGARVVIAVNLEADRFGRGATIPSHGADPGDIPPITPTAKARNGFLGLGHMFGAERALKRELIAGPARPSFSTVMIESFNIMQDRLTRMRLAGDPPDIHITPRIGHVGWLEFHRAAEAIAVGRAAAEKALDSITETMAQLR